MTQERRSARRTLEPPPFRTSGRSRGTRTTFGSATPRERGHPARIGRRTGTMVVGALLLATVLAGRPPAALADHPAAAPDRLFFIGDSLTDYGNLYGATRFLNGQNPLVPVLPPSPPYFAGRYSNGPTYAESLPGLLGVPDANVVSFAFAGAESGDTNAHPQASVLFNSLDIDALDQVGRAIASGAVGPDAIAVYTIGGNDYLNRFGSAAPETLVSTVVGNVGTGIRRLADAGQTRFIVGNLPGLGTAPAARSTAGALGLDPAAFNAVSRAHNAALLTTVTGLESTRGLDITIIDNYGLTADMIDNPGLYGLSDTTDPCFYPNGQPGRDCSTPDAANAGLFYDDIHPTAHVHRISAAYVAAYYDMKQHAGPDLAARSTLGLLASRAQQRLMEARLLSLRIGAGAGTEVALGRFSVHLTGDFGTGDRDGDAGQRGFDYDTTGGMLGLDWRAGEKHALGAAVGYGAADLELDRGRGSADLESWFGSVYGTLGSRTAYLDAAAGYSADDYRFSRPTGFAPRPTASASPGGSTWFALLSGGYHFTRGPTTFGPIVGGRWTRSRIGGYREDAGPLALSVRHTVNESWIGFLGGQAAGLFRFDGLWLAPHVRITAEHDFGDDETVRAELGSGQTISGETAQTEPAAVFGGGLEFGVGAALAAQVTGETTLTRADGMDSGIQGRLLLRF